MMCGLWLSLVPAQSLELQLLHVPAMRARHEIAALVGGLVFPLDPGDAMDRRRRPEQDLRTPREGRRPRLRERNRIALLTGAGDIVKKQPNSAPADKAAARRRDTKMARHTTPLAKG